MILGEKVLPHPCAEIFPTLEGRELDALAEDIKTHGLRVPILLHPDTRILDGRNRYNACLQAGVNPIFRTWSGTPGTEIDFVVSVNLRRRHLSESQRAMVAARIKLQYAVKAKDRQGTRTDLGSNLDQGEAGRSSDKAAADLNVSSSSVNTAAKVLREGSEELVKAVEQGEVSVHAASTIVELPKEEQVELVARGEAEIIAAAKEIRERRKLDALTSSESVEWYTPDPIVALAYRVMGGIDLDPASCEAANRVVKAAKIYTSSDDGLAQNWAGRVWLNPPFDLSSKFVTKLVESYGSGAVTQACLLVGSSLHQRWFRPLWLLPVCFPDGRLSFWTVEDGQRVEEKSPTRGTCIAYLGPNVEAFVRDFALLGHVVVPARSMTNAIHEIDNVSVTIRREVA